MSDTITVWDTSYVTDPHLIQELFPPVPHEYPVIDSEHVEDEDVTFLHFDCEDIGAVAAIVYDDEPGLVFTPEDWQGVQPESIEDADDFHWICYEKEGYCTCVNLSGLPRIFDPTESLMTLWDGEYRVSTAYDSSDPTILGALAEDPDLEVRLAVACNPHTPEDALREFTRSEFTAEEALMNPSTPIDAVTDAMFSDVDVVSELALEVYKHRERESPADKHAAMAAYAQSFDKAMDATDRTEAARAEAARQAGSQQPSENRMLRR